MAYNFAPYQSATRCVGGARPGTIHLAAFLEDQFPKTYFMNIYSCRGVYGGSGVSHHAEGRAEDLGVPTTSTGAAITSIGMPVIQLLGPYGKALGIDHMIYNRRIYAAAYPAGKYYSGLHPHRDHWHIGLTRQAAEVLTITTIKKVVFGTVPPTPPPPTPPPPTTSIKDTDSTMWQYLNIDSAMVKRVWDLGYLQPKTQATLDYFLKYLKELQKGDQASVIPEFQADWLNFRRAVSNGTVRSG